MKTLIQVLSFTASTAIALSTAIASEAISLTNTGGAINDNGVTDFTFTASGITPAVTGKVNLTFSNLIHPDLFELELYFIHGSDTLTLVDSISGTNLTNTVFDDAGLAINTGTAPFTGTFAPQGSSGLNETATISLLAGFNGSDPNGTWTLRIYDNFLGNTGNLGLTTLDIITVPFEFSSALGLLALGGLWGTQQLWKRRKTRLAKMNNSILTCD